MTRQILIVPQLKCRLDWAYWLRWVVHRFVGHEDLGHFLLRPRQLCDWPMAQRGNLVRKLGDLAFEHDDSIFGSPEGVLSETESIGENLHLANALLLDLT